ncbi:MAG TPA: type II secretion system protein [Dehalococcoidia bacterium]|nr:type II secretion system protein [Dehalococcoidia bacterium]
MGAEKGFSLIEVLVSLAIIALIAVGFLSGLSTSLRSLMVTDEMTTAESLARSQMEYIKNQSYSTSEDYNEIECPLGYEIMVLTSELQTGIQKITVSVNHHDEYVTTLEGYKGDR